ncbi:MAG: hypothetical protein R3B99_24285 [Polyangiales bacterium]
MPAAQGKSRKGNARSAELHEEHEGEEQHADPRGAREVVLDAAFGHRRVAEVAVDLELQIVGRVLAELAGRDAGTKAREELLAAIGIDCA